MFYINLILTGTSENQTPTNTSTSDSNTNQEVENESNIDIGLVLKLQHKLAEVERNKDRMQKRLDELSTSPKIEKARTDAEVAARISELELCNSQLKTQLFELQNSINEGKLFLLYC